MHRSDLYTTSTPMIPEGYLKMNVESTEINRKVIDMLHICHLNVKRSNKVVSAYFSDWDSLERAISMIQSSLDDEEINKMKACICECEQDIFGQQYIPFAHLTLRVMNPKFLRIIEDRLFQLKMQPIVKAGTKNVYGYEFFIRPQSKLYMFSPSELFTFAHHAGLQANLDRQARIHSIRTGAQMVDRGKKIFINFVASSIHEPKECLKSTLQAVEDYDLEPSDLVFEVVEAERILNIDHLQNIFGEFKKHGIKVALDDVGTSFSSIERIKELKPDYVKVDRHIIRNCHNNTLERKQLEKLHEITRKLGVDIIAEGVETDEEWTAIKSYVDYGQGYLFGKPIKTPQKEVEPM
ncbi:EAL domain-containing protein [Bacillus shivajii]|uniref:EAL domain-containing protein n=1 Tax=Bacillus shivajii TaxID=1983719 RepID=UPI001CFB4C5A|nr:EAL domain-containing protein [Bacillus shivajii]UCZ52040.1 EAL domain-containing protein [Bacillus shivajii]